MTKKKLKKKRKTGIKHPDKKYRNPVNYSSWLFFGLFVVFAVYMINVQLPYTEFGLDRDEGSYINFGEVLREGGKMYDDIYSMKPPAIYYLYATINTVFGYSAEGLRTSVIFCHILSGLLLFFFGFRRKNELFGFIAGISYLVFAFNPFTYGFAAVTEHYQNFFLILAAVLAQQGILSRKNLWFLAAGLCFAFGVMVKQNLLFAFLAISAGLAWYYMIESQKRQWKPLLYFFGASASTVLLVLLPVIIQGTFDEWIYWNFTYSSLYTSAIPWSRGQGFLQNFFNFTTQFNLWMWIAGVIGILVAIYRNKTIAGKITIGLVLLASILSIFPGLRFYPHYWIYFSPVLAIGCGWTAVELAALLQKAIKRPYNLVIVTGVFAFGIWMVRSENLEFFKDPNEIYVNRRMYGDNPFTESRYLGEFLKKQVRPGDELLMFGSEPQIFTYAGLTSPTPYIFFTHLNKPHAVQQQMKDDFKAWATSNEPEFVYFSNHPFSWGMSQNSDQQFYQWAYRYVNQNYTPIGIADILPGQPPQIVLGEQAVTFQPQSQKWVGIYKRIN